MLLELWCVGLSMTSLLLVSQQLGLLLAKNAWSVTTAESCTGGGIAAAITDVAGSSAWFEQGCVTYSNSAKQTLLGVDAGILKSQGAVSQAVVEAMALGMADNARAEVGLASSGIAGPGGAVAGKPVGTVWLAWCILDKVYSECYLFEGGRQAVRQQATEQSLLGAIELIKKNTV